MTDKNIIQLINKLNRNPNFKDCIKVGIGKNVDLAHLWDNETFSDCHIPYTYFLIKEEEKYVGAVLDMTYDLHWLILPEYQKKGYLSNALKHIILPYIFEEMPRSEQKISIKQNEIGEQNYQNSLKVALSVGFKQIDDENLVIDYNSVNEEDCQLDYQNKGLTDDELEVINKEIIAISKRLYQINSTIEFAFGTQIEEYVSPPLTERVNSITFLKPVFRDMKYDFDGCIKIID